MCKRIAEVSHAPISLGNNNSFKNRKTRREGEFATGFSYPWRNYMKLISRTYAADAGDVAGAGIVGAAFVLLGLAIL